MSAQPRVGSEATGITRAYLQVLDLSEDVVDHLELIASEVLPQVR